MPRGFDSKQKAYIRSKLMDAGRDCFAVSGLKRTRVRELTELAGIAQGTFYHFFDSKELLYFRLLEEDEHQIKEKVKADLLAMENPDTDGFASFLIKLLHEVRKYPLIMRLYTSDDFEQMVRKLPEDVLSDHGEEDLLSFEPVLHHWKSVDLIDHDLSNEAVTGALRGLFLMTLHQKEIGEAVFDESVRFLAEGFAARLFQRWEGAK